MPSLLLHTALTLTLLAPPAPAVDSARSTWKIDVTHSELVFRIRHLVSRRRDVSTVLGEVQGIDADARQVRLDDGRVVSYDTLVLATGARHAYFGHDEWEAYAHGLKTLEDATALRLRILLAFERAEWETDAGRRAALLTFAIIGAGPTGVELAGTIAELARVTLRPDFRNIDAATARIVLIEAGPRVLPGFAADLSEYAKDALERLGVEVELGQPVSECSSEGVVFAGRRLAARPGVYASMRRSSSGGVLERRRPDPYRRKRLDRTECRA